MPRISKEAAEKIALVKQSLSHPIGQLDAAIEALLVMGQTRRADGLRKIVAKLEKWQQK